MFVPNTVESGFTPLSDASLSGYSLSLQRCLVLLTSWMGVYFSAITHFLLSPAYLLLDPNNNSVLVFSHNDHCLLRGRHATSHSVISLWDHTSIMNTIHIPYMHMIQASQRYFSVYSLPFWRQAMNVTTIWWPPLTWMPTSYSVRHYACCALHKYLEGSSGHTYRRLTVSVCKLSKESFKTLFLKIASELGIWRTHRGSWSPNPVVTGFKLNHSLFHLEVLSSCTWDTNIFRNRVAAD